jgi:urea carboxylase
MVVVTALAEPSAEVLLAGVEVLAPGTQTTVQDLGGRRGLWGVGVPPSGAWDDFSFALANRAVGNPSDAAGLEAVLRGPKLRFAVRTVIAVAGAVAAATVDGIPLPAGVPITVDPGQVVDLGAAAAPGLRQYLAVRGGLDVPVALGSRSTFLLGKFGGFEGRALRKGDQLPLGAEPAAEPVDVRHLLPVLAGEWCVRVVPGPHGAPDYLTDSGVDALFGAEWTLDHRSDRTGIRLVGPTPGWARDDGGEAGLHPSNIHDSAYPVGGMMLSGGTPVVVGPDGPSLGGFVVPAVVVRADRWVFAQARPGDTVRLVPVSPEQAEAANRDRALLLGEGRQTTPQPSVAGGSYRPQPLASVPADGGRPELTVRRAGDHHVLVEAGPPLLDLTVRLRIHLLALALGARDLLGVVDLVEGVRSVLIGVDETVLTLPDLAAVVVDAWSSLPPLDEVELPVREVVLPIALDDPLVHEAMIRYQQHVRPDAPWCPDNVEFIRRVNGLATREDVFEIVAEASYLVVGLGDVYLGAPVAVPLDPRHRLVTTKYDPARTWTPANAVGIGGIYLCVYGMEGPGGYQLLGRTVPVWRYDSESDEPPWLLRMFDRLRFQPVSAEQLAAARAEIAAGTAVLETRPATLRLADLQNAGLDPESAAFTARRRTAFADERARWALAAKGAQ